MGSVPREVRSGKYTGCCKKDVIVNCVQASSQADIKEETQTWFVFSQTAPNKSTISEEVVSAQIHGLIQLNDMLAAE